MDKHENNGNFFDSLVDGVYNFNWLLLLSVAISYLYIISTSTTPFTLMFAQLPNCAH